MIEAILSVFLGVFAISSIIIVSMIAFKPQNRCLHSFDELNSTGKYVILVCSRCGKVKRIRR